MSNNPTTDRLIRAPWTPEQVTALNAFQQHGGMHPFTCGYEHPAHPDAVLRATKDGWRCYVTGCDYEQDWAHAFMADAAALAAVPVPPATPATDRAATCICGHTEQQHFEDVCITEVTGCQCGDYLPPDAAAEVIDRWRTAAIEARAAGLTEAADFVRGLLLTRTSITTAGLEAELRRMADEAQQPGIPRCPSCGHSICDGDGPCGALLRVTVASAPRCVCTGPGAAGAGQDGAQQ